MWLPTALPISLHSPCWVALVWLRFDAEDALHGRRRQLRHCQPELLALFKQLVDRAERLDPTIIKNCNSVAHVLDIGQQMRRQQDCLAAFGQRLNQIFYLPATDWIETGYSVVGVPNE